MCIRDSALALAGALRQDLVVRVEPTLAAELCDAEVIVSLALEDALLHRCHLLASQLFGLGQADRLRPLGAAGV
eukprot:12204398-Alexandrium_andersonii.AAC.1